MTASSRFHPIILAQLVLQGSHFLLELSYSPVKLGLRLSLTAFELVQLRSELGRSVVGHKRPFRFNRGAVDCRSFLRFKRIA